MDTLFLATVLGWYFLIFSLFLLLRYELVKTAVGDIFAERGLFFVLAIITVILGLLMVVSHNVWVKDWPVAVTLVGWVTLISGIIRLFCPDMVKKRGASFIHHASHVRIVGALLLLLGLFLLFHVYYHG